MFKMMETSLNDLVDSPCSLVKYRLEIETLQVLLVFIELSQHVC